MIDVFVSLVALEMTGFVIKKNGKHLRGGRGRGRDIREGKNKVLISWRDLTEFFKVNLYLKSEMSDSQVYHLSLCQIINKKYI